MANSYSYPASFVATATNDISGTNTSRTGIIPVPFKIHEVWFFCTTTLAGATPSVISVKREPLALTTTGTSTLGTFPLLTATAGDVVKADFRTIGDTYLAPCESIAFVSDGGLDTGVGYFIVLGHVQTEGPFPHVSFTTVDKPRSGTGDIRYAVVTEV